MSAPKFKALISGAGIAGPCLAYWLARTRPNFAITVVERSPVPRVTGQAIDVRGSAIDVIKAMNLEEEMRARHTTEVGARFVNSTGGSIAQFDARGNFTAEYEILRADLSQLLLGATENFSNVKYVYGDYIKSLEQNGKRVQVAFNGGSTETFDVVVGADGSTSKTRSMILDEQNLKDSYKFLGQYIAFFSIPKVAKDEKLWYWYNAPKGLVVMTRPHRNDTTMGAYFCITTPSRGTRDPIAEEAMDAGNEEKKQLLHKYFSNAGWESKRVLEGMDQADDFYMSRAAQVKIPKWTSGRAAVIGDAAFATFGIGTSLAIESAYVLAGELSKIQSSDDIPEALNRYEAVFRPRCTDLEEIPPGFPQLACPQTIWGLRLRNLVLWLVGKTQVYKLFQGMAETKWELPKYDWIDAPQKSLK